MMTGRKRFISIAVPTYQRTDFVRENLESCLNQDYSDYEILVSDDSDHDRIGEICRSYGSDRLKYVRNDPPLGLERKLNRFLEWGRGEWMTVLCDDDRLEPGYLPAMAGHVERHPDAALVRCRYRLIDRAGKLMRLDREPEKLVMGPYEFVSKIFLPEKLFFKMNISGILFPRQRLRTLGGFGSFYRGAHTDRWAWTLLGSSGPSVHEPQALCSVRLHTGSITSQFGPDLERLVSAELSLKALVDPLLDRMEREAPGGAERAQAAEAKKNFTAYLRRHLGHSFDQALWTALMSSDRPKENVRRISDRMRELGVPLFRSAHLYRLLAAAPAAVRRPALRALASYKLSKTVR